LIDGNHWAANAAGAAMNDLYGFMWHKYNYLRVIGDDLGDSPWNGLGLNVNKKQRRILGEEINRMQSGAVFRCIGMLVAEIRRLENAAGDEMVYGREKSRFT